MANRKMNGSGGEHHQRAVELQDGAAHAHLVAAATPEKQDHQTGHELSSQAREHSRPAHEHTDQAHPGGASGHLAGHEELAILAHRLWEARGRPEGSPEEDWFHAEIRLQGRGQATSK